MPKTTTFEGDLADQGTVRAKLADIDAKIERRERLRDRLEDELDGLERLRQGLLVILGEKDAETDQARTERLEALRKRSEQWHLMRERAAAAQTIQAQVENVVNALGSQVSAGDVLDYLPAGTKRETVNYALWRAAETKRIRRISQGVYAPLAIAKASSSA